MGNENITFEIKDGIPIPGENGATFTPSVSSEGVISWTNDKDLPNPESVNIKGPAGADGHQGTDGVSPTVTVTQITGGHQISITDAQGTNTFNVMDGSDGAAGQIGPAGANGTTFTPSVSNAGVISWSNDGGKQNPQSVYLVAAVIAALPTWNGGNY